jgi:hypothetical protein
MSYLDMLKAAKERLGLSELREKRVLSLPTGIKQKEAPPAKEANEENEGRGERYAFPWPDEIQGLGRRRVGPFDSCGRCGYGTWVRYGGEARCLACSTETPMGGSQCHP